MTKYKYLDSLALRFGTDKSSEGHDYMKYYAEHLPDSCRSLLEIGCAEGKSGLMWDSFYGKDELELSYIDLFENTDFVSQRFCWNRGWRAYKGNQHDTEFLYGITDKFDVIIEDGSHDSIDQIASFKHLFCNNLKSGGLWVTEDLHCCNDEFYRQNEEIEFEDTLLSVFKKYIESGSLLSRYFSRAENVFFKENIKSIDLHEDKICFLQKK